MSIKVLDLFSAAAGGWSLGMHRAGFETMAACEAVEWRRVLYAQNNPGVKVYDDVRTLTAKRILGDFGRLPDIVVGSPPCQDISSANTKGKGVEGERSGLFFEAVRIIGECRPRWFALENSSNLRTRGADAVLDALEALGYTCWAVVVRAGDIGANHERPRAWIIGCDLEQVANPDGDRWPTGRAGRRLGSDLSVANDPLDTAGIGHEGGWSRRHGAHGDGAASVAGCDAADTAQIGCPSRPGTDEGEYTGSDRSGAEHGAGDGPTRNTPDPDQAGQADGCLEPSLRQAEIALDGRGDRRGDDGQGIGQVAVCAADRGAADQCRPLWSLDDLAGRLWLDDGLPARVAGTRVAVGGPRGTTAASLIVEAYGDAVVPQIPEAIGRAIIRVERAMTTLIERQAA